MRPTGRDAAAGTYTDLSATDAGMDYLYGADEVGTTLKIVGIVARRIRTLRCLHDERPPSAIPARLTDARHRRPAADSDIVKAQLADPATDVLLGSARSRPGTRPPSRLEAENGRRLSHGAA